MPGCRFCISQRLFFNLIGDCMKKLLAFIFALMCSLHVYAQTTADYYLENLGTTDNFVRSSAPTTSFGTSQYIQVGGWGDTYKGLLKFDISTLPQLAAGEKVSIWLYNVQQPTGAQTPTQVKMAMNSANFTDATTWNTNVGTLLPLKTVNVAAYGYWTEFDITEYYLAWKSGAVTNNGIQLIPVNVSNNFDFFAASGSATPYDQKPLLRITRPIVTDTLLENLSPVDTFVRSSGGGGGFPNEAILEVGGWGDTYKALVKFDVSTLPALATGDKALLRFYSTVQAGNQTPTQMNMAMNASAFSNATVWANSPAASGTPRLVNVSAYGYWTELDITDYYNQWKAGTTVNNGIQLTPVATSNNFNFFASTNSTFVVQKPIIRIEQSITPDPYRFLSFPLKSVGFMDWKTAELISVMDHTKNDISATVLGSVDSNTTVTAFNGESGSNYPGNYQTVWCPYRATSDAYLTHPIGKNIPYKGDSNNGCLGKSTLSYNGHNGFDYGVSAQTKVYASATGTVTENQCTGSGGLCSSVGRVILKHTITVGGVQKTYYTWYMHLANAVLVNNAAYSIGQVINEGEQLGLSGSTGAGTAEHLHFEVRVGGDGTSNDYGAPVDPFGWYGSGSDPLNTTTGYQTYYTNEGHTNRLLWKK